MIDGLKPYPEMRATGVEWLPALPDGWQMRRAKYSFSEVDDRSEAGGEELLSVSHKNGVTPRSQNKITMFMAESYEGHKVCRPGDIVVNTMWAWMAAVGVSRCCGIVSPAYGIYSPRSTKNFNPNFLDYLLRTEFYRAEYMRSSRGITTSRLRLYPPDFLNIPLVQPFLDEQRLIVHFLNWHGAQTAKIIRAKQNLLRLAAEKREILIRDVTSLYETQWLRLDRVVYHCFRGVNRTGRSEFVPVGLYNRGRGIFKKRPTPGDELGDSTFSWIEKDDLILSGQFSWEGAVALAGVEQAGCIASHRYHILRAREDITDVRYVSALFRSGFGNFILNQHSRGAAGRNRPLNIRSLLKEPIPVPKLQSCSQLVSLIHIESGAIRSIQKSIEVLREFRSKIIADVVTGKLDVRAAAASLPALTEADPADAFIDDDALDEAANDLEGEEVAA